MTDKLKSYIDTLIRNGLEKNYWFITKQNLTDFYLPFFIAGIVETYETKSFPDEKFRKYYQRCFNENIYTRTHFPKQCESENTYRNAIVAEFLGLFYRPNGGSSYDTGVVTDAYAVLKRYIKSPDDINKYRYLVDRQIEKLALNINDSAQIYNSIKDVNIFPVIFLYKILFELSKKYNDSKLEWNEFLLFLTHAQKNDEWKTIFDLIVDYRNAIKENSIDNNYKNKIKAILTDVTMSNIRYDTLFNSLTHIRCTSQGCYILNDYESKVYVENVLEIFEHSDYKNETNKTKLKSFLRSDNYFIGKLECISKVTEKINDSDNGEQIDDVMKQLFLAWLKPRYQLTTQRKYLSAINVVSRLLDTNLYLVPTLDELNKLFTKYINNEEFMKKDKIVKYADSNGFKRYIEFFTDFASNKFSKEEFKMNYKERGPRTDKTNPLNQIIYGAPGTGKTYSTPEYAVAIIEKRKPRNNLSDSDREKLMKKYKEFVESKRIVFTTFHQSYGYEDFIEGLRPLPSENHTLYFDNIDGIFKTICNKAGENPDDNFVIIIDEINRGNISKIFGELITLIEPNKRFGEKEQIIVTLPFGEPFSVPNNLYIIGTMNSADKSISLIDAALRRRFVFIEKTPDYNLISDSKLRNILQSLNTYLREAKKTSDLLIGHSYFMNETIDNLPEIMQNNIIPLLYEYFFDDENDVIKALNKCLDGTGFTVEKTETGRIKIKK